MPSLPWWILSSNCESKISPSLSYFLSCIYIYCQRAELVSTWGWWEIKNKEEWSGKITTGLTITLKIFSPQLKGLYRSCTNILLFLESPRESGTWQIVISCSLEACFKTGQLTAFFPRKLENLSTGLCMFYNFLPLAHIVNTLAF